VMATLAQSDAAVQELSNDIDSATGGITVHAAVADKVGMITAELELIMARARELAPEAAMIDLAALSGRYTMHSERAVHASFSGAAAPLMGEMAAQVWDLPSPGASAEEESELGDNIELF